MVKYITDSLQMLLIILLGEKITINVERHNPVLSIAIPSDDVLKISYLQLNITSRGEDFTANSSVYLQVYTNIPVSYQLYP